MQSIAEISTMVRGISHEMNIVKIERERKLLERIENGISTVSKLGEQLISSISDITSVEPKVIRETKANTIQYGRMIERKLDELIADVETLAELKGVEVKKLGKLGISYDGMRFLRRKIIPELVSIADVYLHGKERMAGELRHSVKLLKMAINMIKNGEPIPPEEVEE